MKLFGIVKTKVIGLKNWLSHLSIKRKVFALIVVLIVGFLGYRQLGSAKQQPQYLTATAQQGTLISSVTENGNIATGSQAGVGSPTTGIIENIYVKDGDNVKAGDKLFSVKSIATAQEIASAWSTYQTEVTAINTSQQAQITDQSTLEQARQAILDAQTNVNIMQYNLSNSYPNPTTKQPYTQVDIDSINSALTSARETFNSDQQKYLQSGQNINSAQAAENSAYLAYETTQDSTVTAPIDGTVANITVKPGDQITASAGNLSSELSSNNSSSSSTNNPVLFVGNFSNPYIKVQASEVDVPNIHTGEKATITFNAFPSQTFTGSVYQVDTTGTNTSGVITYNVFIDLIAPPSTIRPGMSANVTIETARADNALIVPSSAVQTASGQETVQILQNGQITTVPITTGLTSATQTQITSGLSAGQTVITGVLTTSSNSSSTGTSPFSGGLRLGGFGGGGTRGGGGTAAGGR